MCHILRSEYWIPEIQKHNTEHISVRFTHLKSALEYAIQIPDHISDHDG